MIHLGFEEPYTLTPYFDLRPQNLPVPAMISLLVLTVIVIYYDCSSNLNKANSILTKSDRIFKIVVLSLIEFCNNDHQCFSVYIVWYVKEQ